MGTIRYTIPQKLVRAILANRQVENFIETGTGSGSTAIWAAPLFKNIFTIEKDSETCKKALENTKPYPNIQVITGNSEDKLPEVISKLKGRSVFFLDTHSYTQDNQRTVVCPLLAELKAISACENPIIFINDVRCFLGPMPDARKTEWPTFEQIFALCKELFPDFYITIIDGVLTCAPKEVESIIAAYWVETFDERSYVPDPEPRKRSFFERAISKSKKILAKKKPLEVETVAYDIKHSAWFENELKKFRESHRWLLNYEFKAIVDIGANVGQFGKKIRQYYPEAHLYSFEPIPLVYKELLDNFKNDKHFTPFNVGLGDKEGKMEFYMNEFSDSSSMLKMGDLHKKNFPYTKYEKKIFVDIKTLDNCVDASKIEKPYLLKLDVQGFEEQVINGGSELVRNAEMIITEISYKVLYEGQPLFDTLYEKIKSYGFQYIGDLEEMNSAFNGEPLQSDAIFVKIKK